MSTAVAAVRGITLNPVIPHAIEISSGFFTALVQLAVSAGFAGLVVQLLLIRQNRRKIEGEASTSEANAASVLSGTALKFVEQANADTAKARADAASARSDADKARDEQTRYFEALQVSRWETQHLKMRIEVLEAALRSADIHVPDEPKELSDRPPFRILPPGELGAPASDPPI